jgi:methylthioribose-1-phosphate isomerase
VPLTIQTVRAGPDRTSRPTAVNLFWALERMKQSIEPDIDRLPAKQLNEGLLKEALAIEEEDRQMCREIGRVGAELIGEGEGVLTHCNAHGSAVPIEQRDPREVTHGFGRQTAPDRIKVYNPA